MAGQSKEFFVVLKKIFSDPSSIGKWGKSIEVKIINGPLRVIRKFLNFLKERLDSWDMPKFSDIVNKILEGINGLIKKIYNTDGWKGALLMTGLGLAVKWVWNKVGDFVEGGIDKIKSFMVDGGKGVVLEKFSKWFNGEFKKIFSDVVKDTLGSLGSSVVSSLTGIGAFIDWAKKAFNGIKFVLDTFGEAVSRFNRERKVGVKVGNIQL
jgi:phage-related protein